MAFVTRMSILQELPRTVQNISQFLEKFFEKAEQENYPNAAFARRAARSHQDSWPRYARPTPQAKAFGRIPVRKNVAFAPKAARSSFTRQIDLKEERSVLRYASDN